jgi:hypothetical protein
MTLLVFFFRRPTADETARAEQTRPRAARAKEPRGDDVRTTTVRSVLAMEL